jgi:AraC-like DNA-binding protein
VHYQEHEPQPFLKPYVKCYWTLKLPEFLPSNHGQQFLTDGIEIIFKLAGSYEIVENESTSSTAVDTGITGPMTRPMTLRPIGLLEMFGICFFPGGGYPFFSLPAHELTDQYASLDELWGSNGLRFENRIKNTCRTTKSRICELDKYLSDRLKKCQNDDMAVDAALHAVLSYKGQITVEYLTQYSGLSCRQLERKFKERIGVSPKQLCRSVRFKYIFKYLEASPSESWASVALACGYYDQSHMIRDFKHYTGLSPNAYFDNYQKGMEKFFTDNF